MSLDCWSVAIGFSLAVLLSYTAPGLSAMAQQPHEQKLSDLQPIDFENYKKTVSLIDYKKHLITLSELEGLIDAGKVCVLDLRSEREYDDGHIRGAMLMGCDISEAKLSKLLPNKETKVVIYCTNNFYPSRKLSLNNACLPQFLALGYKNTLVLDELWRSGFEVPRQLKEGPFWVKSSSPTGPK